MRKIFYYLNITSLMTLDLLGFIFSCILRLYMLTCEVCDFGFEDSIHRDVLDKRNVVFERKFVVVSTEGWSNMDDARSRIRRHKIPRVDFPGVFTVFQL